MKPRIGIPGTLITVLLCCVHSSAAYAEEVPDYLRIKRIDYRGPACPAGTVDISLVADNTRFIVIFDVFNVEAGPDAPLTESSKFCNLLIYPDYPAGWTWTVASIAYRGNAILSEAVKGRFRARYSFPGLRSVSQDVVLFGPYLGDFDLLQPLDVFTWAPCGAGEPAPMTVTSTGQVDNTANRNKKGLLTVEQTDGAFKLVVNLKWRRCI